MRKLILPKKLFRILLIALFLVFVLEGLAKGVVLKFTTQEVVICTPTALEKYGSTEIILGLACDEGKKVNLRDVDIILSYANDPSSVRTLFCKFNGLGHASCEVQE